MILINQLWVLVNSQAAQKLTKTKTGYWCYLSFKVTDEPNMNISEHQHTSKEKWFPGAPLRRWAQSLQRRKSRHFYQEMPGIVSYVATYISRNWLIRCVTPFNIFRLPQCLFILYEVISTTPCCANAKCKVSIRAFSSLITSPKLQLVLSKIKRIEKLWGLTEITQ